MKPVGAIHELVLAEDLGCLIIKINDLINRFTDLRWTDRSIIRRLRLLDLLLGLPNPERMKSIAPSFSLPAGEAGTGLE
jgi:hypothetical protein